MSLRLLRTLLAVADERTFSAAADKVNVTHAAVSQQMRALEADLGIALFNRSKRTPELTPAAHQVVARARKIIADYDGLVPSVLGDGGLSGVFTLGALRTTLTGLAPRALAQLHGQFPEARFHIRPGLTGRLLADVERGALDAALVTKPHLMPVGLVFRPIAEEAMHLIAAQEEPEDDPQILLRERRFIRYNRTAVVGTLIDNWIVAQRIRVTETMELDSPEAIASMVHANLGVSIVPDPVVPPPVAIPVKKISLGPDAPRRDLGLVHTEGSPKIKAMDEICEALSSVVADAGARPSRTSS